MSRQVIDIAAQQTAALLLSQAVHEALPLAIPIQAKVTPNFFQYDFIYNAKLDEQILPHIFQKMKQLQHQDPELEFRTMMRENAIELFLHHDKKVQAALLEDEPNNLVTICKVGSSFDLCQYEPLASAKELRDFCLYDVQSEELFYPTLGMINMLRIKGAVFHDKKALKEFLKQHKIAKQNDPVVLCEKQNLILLKERPFWLGDGMAFRDTVLQQWKSICQKRGFDVVSTPNGKEDKLKAHRELFTHYERPCRFAETFEKELLLETKDAEGLFVTKSVFCDSAHIFCKRDELASELNSSLQFIQEIGTLFALEYSYMFFFPKGKRDQKSIDAFTCALEKNGCVFEAQEHKSAAVGARIEVYAEDVVGTKWLVACLKQVLGTSQSEAESEFLTISQCSFFSLERVVALLVERNGELKS